MSVSRGAGAERRERLARRHEVVGAGERMGEVRQPVRWPPWRPPMLSSIASRIALVARRSPTKIVPWRGQRPVGDVAPEDLAERVLVGARDVRRRRLRVELLAVGLAPADVASCAVDRQRRPRRSTSCSHCWSSRIAAALAGRAGRRRSRRTSPRRASGSRCRPEAGQVAVVVVRPADDLVRQRRVRRRAPSTTARREVEDEVVGSAGQPDDDVVLGRRQGVAVRARPSAR